MFPVSETLFHAEEGVYRGVTGVSSNFPSAANGVPVVANMPTKGTVPLAKPMTGTFQTTGINVRGTGTLFTSEFKVTDYLYDGNVVRKIVAIEGDGIMRLEQAFPTDVTADTTPKKCERQTFKFIQIRSTGGAAAILQEATFAVNDIVYTGGAPISYDATTGQISFTVHK